MKGNESYSVAEAAALLKVPPPVIRALATSGLLGYWTDRIPAVAVDHFGRYGTQWRPELKRRTVPQDHVDGFNVPGFEEGAAPSASMQMRIAPKGVGLESSGEDTGWLAHFYLRPNPFFFPNADNLALVGPVGLRLAAAREVKGTALPCYMYPDPTGHLALLSVIGPGPPHDRAAEQAYDVVSPVLDMLSLAHDQPLPIAQFLVVGIPSGVITIDFARQARPISLDRQSTVEPGPQVPELADAIALYREGISSNSPFSQFLSLWRAYESACEARGTWRRLNKRRDIKLADEIIPAGDMWLQYRTLKFDEAKQALNDPYRVAIAHGYVEGGKPRTGSTAKDFFEVSSVILIVRYMARVTILNVQHTYQNG